MIGTIAENLTSCYHFATNSKAKDDTKRHASELLIKIRQINTEWAKGSVSCLPLRYSFPSLIFKQSRSGDFDVRERGRMTAALIAEGLHTYYGKSHILHGVSLEAAEGQVTALLGRNGAGKTTTLRSLMGLTPPRDGRVMMFGTDTTGWPPFRVAALGVGYVPEGRRIFPNLTVDENLLVPLGRSGP